MLWTLIVILLVLWLVGWRWQPGGSPFFGEQNSVVHILLVLVVILLLFRLL